MNWSNAGGASLARLNYRDALADLLKARQLAKASGLPRVLASVLNNLASLYLQMANNAAAAQVAAEALTGPARSADAPTRARLQFQIASALTRLGRFNEAEPDFRGAVNELEEQGDFDTTAQILSNWGGAALRANRLDEAENVLDNALLLARDHRLEASADLLLGLAQVKSRRGDARSAAALFDGALAATAGLTPRWTIFTGRGEFRLDRGDLRGALEDFREARRLAALLRADIVPADQDRIALEGDLSRTASGLIESGNRLARQRRDHHFLAETFDAAEQDRLWSLRVLLPASNDWRTRVPENYWDLLARYQSAERNLLDRPSPETEKQTSALQIQLQEIEAMAAPRAELPGKPLSALLHVRSVLDADSVLFSFSVLKTRGWLWAVDRHHVSVYPIPGREELRSRIEGFSRSTRENDARAAAMGSGLYQDLFGAVSASYLAHKRWLLEPDGPLFDLPFGALVVGIRKDEPIYLIDRAALELVPGALMLQRPSADSFGNGEFLGIGDPVYNAADTRFTGDKPKKQPVALPRLVDTGAEIEACSRAWGARTNKILTGPDADLAGVRKALQSKPSIIHFATHVLTAPEDHASGLIALSLDPTGSMGLMGPPEIVAHAVSADLVVLNGCHSGQGDALPGSGLMGLTRAWIGAGAKSVLATRWDIPDEAAKTVMVGFYSALRANPKRGPAEALRQAQLAILNDRSGQYSHTNAALWAAYFLLGRE